MKENLQFERKTINFLEQGNIFKHAGDFFGNSAFK